MNCRSVMSNSLGAGFDTSIVRFGFSRIRIPLAPASYLEELRIATVFADIAAAGYARHIFMEIDDFHVEQFNAIAGIIFRNRFDDLFREMEKLGRSIEDSLFGRAVCFLVLRKMDLVREIQS